MLFAPVSFEHRKTYIKIDSGHAQAGPAASDQLKQHYYSYSRDASEKLVSANFAETDQNRVLNHESSALEFPRQIIIFCDLAFLLVAGITEPLLGFLFE
jgi:hypothetical protein